MKSSRIFVHTSLDFQDISKACKLSLFRANSSAKIPPGAAAFFKLAPCHCIMAVANTKPIRLKIHFFFIIVQKSRSFTGAAFHFKPDYLFKFGLF